MALLLPDPYAEVSDLESYWRALSQDEQGRAATLLAWAAKLINEQPGSADFDPLTCAQVSMDMVKRAMINGNGVVEATNAQAMADMSASITSKYANPMGNLYLTDAEADRLAGRSNGSAFSVTLKSNARVSPYPWNRQNSCQVDAGSQP